MSKNSEIKGSFVGNFIKENVINFIRKEFPLFAKGVHSVGFDFSYKIFSEDMLKKIIDLEYKSHDDNYALIYRVTRYS